MSNASHCYNDSQQHFYNVSLWGLDPIDSSDVALVIYLAVGVSFTFRAVLQTCQVVRSWSMQRKYSQMKAFAFMAKIYDVHFE